VGNYREIVILLAADSVTIVTTKGKRFMKRILSLALFTLFIGSTAVIACDMGESDNMCKAGQVFDPEKGECRDVSV
tara:strand:- start:42 stop:269 length:228 start_codon:yes stop_codon:yes gene_type:complete